MNRNKLEHPNVPLIPQRTTGQHFHQRTLSEHELSQQYFVECDFSQVRLTDSRLQKLCFERCTFNDVSLAHCLLEHCVFNECQFHSIKATDTSMFQLSCHDSSWHECRLEDCLIEHWVINQSRLENLALENVHLAYWTAENLTDVNLSMAGGILQDAVWHGSHLRDCRWQNVRIDRQVMGDCTLDGCVYQQIEGSSIWNHCQAQDTQFQITAWKNGSSFNRSRLHACSLAANALPGMSFAESSLVDCDFSGANLTQAQFTDASLDGCHFQNADLQRSTWVRARLERCDFNQALLDKTDLRATHWQETILHPARAGDVRLHGARYPAQKNVSSRSEPLLERIDAWYGVHQPGPENPKFPSRPSGASRYV